MKTLLTVLILTMTSTYSAFSQNKSDFDVIQDNQSEALIYKGACSAEDLKTEKTFDWFTKGMAEYKPDTMAIAFLKKHLTDYDIVVIMGTWCEDSHNLVPKFFKTLEAAGYPATRVTMYGVDRNKEAKYIEHKAYKVERVPTIILIKNHGEVGRIVESVKKNVETDMVQLIK